MADFQSPFPESPRTIFNPNPITMALGQVRFPTILSISAEPPANFQSAIRDRFPIYRERQGMTLQLGQPTFLLQPDARIRVHDFATEDEEIVITLAQDFLSLQTSKYGRWEEFRSYLELGLRALYGIYKPSFIDRVGLRYQNMIVRSALELDGAPWKALLKPEVAGELTNDSCGAMILERATRLRLRLNDQGDEVTINHGLVKSTQNEESYLIDADFYAQRRIPADAAVECFESLKRHSGRFFRWAISDHLYQAMGPAVVE